VGKPSRKKRDGKPGKTPAPINAPAEPAPPASGPSPAAWRAAHIILIAAVAIIAYSNTFQVPFQFDDTCYIKENPMVPNLGYFLDPQETEVRGLPQNVLLSRKTRPLGYLSFALNHKVHGLDVAGYHIANLSIHVMNAVLLYLIVILTFRTPNLSSSELTKHSGSVALFSALLFVSHPLQTEAVTYITQRFASLAAFFYLLSLVSYIKARFSIKNSKRLLFYGLCLLSALSAMKTKEISFTLPLALALYEFTFMRGDMKRRLLYLLPFLLMLPVVPLGVMRTEGSLWEALADATTTHIEVSRWEYLFTQFRVVVTYIRLLFLPVEQNLDYDYPMYKTFLAPGVFLSFLFLLVLFSGSVFFYRRSGGGGKGAGLRLVGFGVLWFLLTLSVESSVIALADVIFEHRAYLPSAGLFISVSAAAFYVVRRRAGMRVLLSAALVMIVMSLSAAAYSRNFVWGSELGLWRDVARKSPDKARPHNNLGVAYKNEGMFDEAINEYRTALLINPKDVDAHNNLGTAYERMGMFEEAVREIRTAISIDPDFAKGHFNLGVVHAEHEQYDKAIEEFQIVLSINPYDAKAHNNLGNAYKKLGLYDEAAYEFNTALGINPYDAIAHNNLGALHFDLGRYEEAIREYRAALGIKPDDAKAHYNLGNAYERLGDYGKAVREYRAALEMDPEYVDAHNNLGIIYRNQRLFEDAVREYRAALLIKPEDAKAHYNLGALFFDLGRYEEARKEFQAAASIEPNDPELKRNLELAYELMGKGEINTPKKLQ
jgi:Flp pilus assembly protein TadD